MPWEHLQRPGKGILPAGEKRILHTVVCGVHIVDSLGRGMCPFVLLFLTARFLRESESGQPICQKDRRRNGTAKA